VKTGDHVVIDGYDLLAESERLAFPDHTVCGRTINRGTASVPVGGVEQPRHEEVRAAHLGEIMPSTLEDVSPVLDLSCPVAGMFVDSPNGTYMDLYQAVAQKLVDEQHPVFQSTTKALLDQGLIFRREINTDDYEMFSTPVEGVHTPQELAALINRLTAASLPAMGRTRCFFSNSGAEAGEASLKLAMLHCYRRFLRKYDASVLSAVMTDLEIERDAFFDADASLPDPVFTDYPFFLFGCDQAFHGRTLGVLNLTRSKKAHQLGFPKSRWRRHVTFNGDPGDLAALLDTRPITEILDSPGGVSAVLDGGKVPVDLAAMFATEVYQGEGGYTLADKAWLGGMAETCKAHGILLGVDEVQSFGRTGSLYAVEHFGVTPDVLWTAKAAVLGITVARSEIVDDCHGGWHSNTFGSGKLFDVNMSYATWHLLAEHVEPLFGDRTLLENSRLKGEYVRMRLAELSAAHPDVFPSFSGLGGMWGLTVRHRDEVVATGWRLGLKLLGCGNPGELSRIRILLLADVLTREIDEMVACLDRVFSAVEEAHPEED
jgi:4-aminobutyrate aminotransferase-like enzyme